MDLERDWPTNDVDRASIPPHLARPQLNEHCQGFLCCCLVGILQCAVQKALHRAVEAVVVVPLVCTLDICMNQAALASDAGQHFGSQQTEGQ